MDNYDIREIQKRVEEAPNKDPFPGKIAPVSASGRRAFLVAETSRSYILAHLACSVRIPIPLSN